MDLVGQMRPETCGGIETTCWAAFRGASYKCCKWDRQFPIHPSHHTWTYLNKYTCTQHRKFLFSCHWTTESLEASKADLGLVLSTGPLSCLKELRAFREMLMRMHLLKLKGAATDRQLGPPRRAFCIRSTFSQRKLSWGPGILLASCRYLWKMLRALVSGLLWYRTFPQLVDFHDFYSHCFLFSWNISSVFGRRHTQITGNGQILLSGDRIHWGSWNN